MQLERSEHFDADDHNCFFNPTQDGGMAKSLPTIYTNVVISFQDLLTFSFDSFAILV